MVSRRERRDHRLSGRGDERSELPAVASERHAPRQESGFRRFYHDNYKALLIIPVLLLILSIAQIGYQMYTTGDFIHKGVSLQGGLTITLPAEGETVDIDALQSSLRSAFPANDVIVRGISELGQLRAVEIEAAASTDERAEMQALERGIVAAAAQSLPVAAEDYSVEVIGPSLGESFFDQVLRAMFIAFILMGAIIFLSFGDKAWAKAAAVVVTLAASFLIFNADTALMWGVALLLVGVLVYLYITHSVPSSFIILAALSDILVTVAAVNLLGVKLSTAGVAAFLMLIGYSVDTDILLTTRVLKHKRGTVEDRILSSFKTGMTMSLASLAAALAGYFVSQSSTIKEIMLIVAIGLVVDMIMTWIQNVSLLRMYVERKGIE